MEYALRFNQFSLNSYAARRLNPCFNGICSAMP